MKAFRCKSLAFLGKNLSIFFSFVFKVSCFLLTKKSIVIFTFHNAQFHYAYKILQPFFFCFSYKENASLSRLYVLKLNDSHRKDKENGDEIRSNIINERDIAT